MKIRSLELRNFRKFVGAVRVQGIGGGLNVLVGRNEYGKSTLLEAINGVIFEKATAHTERTRSFRHFVNGTVPEVTLCFDLDGTQWNLHKRFAGPAGRAVLTDQNGRRCEGEEAEAELQALLGFERRPRSAEPGIWGTLWVQQGKSFADTNLDEMGRRSLQGCIEAQVGVVTGGERGRKIPTAVEDALFDIQTRATRAPRGKFKVATDGLAQTRDKIAQLDAKRVEIFRYMDELADLRRDRQRALADWTEDAHQRELSDARDRHVAAATKAAEISAARNAAKHTAERAKRAEAAVVEREALVAELDPLEVEIGGLKPKFDEAEQRRAEVRSQLDTTEGRLVGLRQQQRDNGAKARRLERIRSAQAIANEIEDHEETLAKAAELRSEVGRLIEAIGANSATEENLSRVEDATTELEGARAAIRAVSTTVSFALDHDAARRVRLDGGPLGKPIFSVPIVTKTTIAVDGVGEITIEPQIAARDEMIERARRAEDDLRAALETAGAADLPAARRSAAQRSELVRELTGKQREIGRLAPADKARRLPAGVEARATRVAELRGRLATEIETLALTSLPTTAETEEAISAAHREGASISVEIDTADAALEGPKRSVAEAQAAAQEFEKRLIRVRATLDGKREQLAASRSRCDDGGLKGQAEWQAREAADAATALEELERKQGETVEEIDVRIKRLEEAARQHKADIDRLNNEISRLGGVLEANEGIGVEEALDEAHAEEARLELQTKHYQEEAAVLALLRNTLGEAESEAKQRYVTPVVQRAAPYLRMLLPETDLVFDEDLSINAIERSGATESFARLSAGTQEQLAVLTRLAFAELLLDQGRPATIILDDALVFSDDDRIERMFDILMRASEKVQIIVLTCRRRLFARLGAPVLEIAACGEAA